MLMPAQQATTYIPYNYAASIETVEIKPQSVEEVIRGKARLNNIDEDKVIFIARCESQIDPNALGDGHFTCKKTGNPMRSRGIWQINECGHAEVTDEQAFDVNWSTDWAMEIFKKGNEGKEWKTCTQKYVKSQKAKEIARAE